MGLIIQNLIRIQGHWRRMPTFQELSILTALLGYL